MRWRNGLNSVPISRQTVTRPADAAAQVFSDGAGGFESSAMQALEDNRRQRVTRALVQTIDAVIAFAGLATASAMRASGLAWPTRFTTA
ncbi:hypothetical protein DMH17_11525 [Raoultella planticola]|nr:hypothetical protein [Raoultella planticola]